jgi:hypothetical protein
VRYRAWRRKRASTSLHRPGEGQLGTRRSPERRCETLPARAPVYVILEKAALPLPPFLQRYWKRVYEPDLDNALAELIAAAIDSHAARLQLIEEHRSRVYR